MASERVRVGTVADIDGDPAHVWRYPDGEVGLTLGDQGATRWIGDPVMARDLGELLDRAAMPGQPAPTAEASGDVMCELPGDCANGPDAHPFIAPLEGVSLPCCRQPWEGNHA